MSKEIKSWRELIQQNGSTKPNHPKLSIPKKIVEELDKKIEIDWELWEFFIDDEEFSNSNDFYNWLNNENNDNYNSKIAIAYLAGKALGVELVEVTNE